MNESYIGLVPLQKFLVPLYVYIDVSPARFALMILDSLRLNALTQ